MATRSIIALQEKDSVSSIYCHWDGYPAGVGRTLLDNYQTLEKIKSLLALGDISSLGDDPCEGVTVAYGRDRGEDHIHAKVHIVADAQSPGGLERCGSEFVYLYRKGHWYMSDGDKWVKMTQQNTNWD